MVKLWLLPGATETLPEGEILPPTPAEAVMVKFDCTVKAVVFKVVVPLAAVVQLAELFTSVL